MSLEDESFIRLRLDDVGLYTAQLVSNAGIVLDDLGGSYAKWTPVMIHASKKWGGNLSSRWISVSELKLENTIQISGTISVSN